MSEQLLVGAGRNFGEAALGSVPAPVPADRFAGSLPFGGARPPPEGLWR